MARTANPDPDLRSLTVEQLVSHLRDSPLDKDAPSDAQDASPYVEEIIRRFEPLLRTAWRRVPQPYDYQDFLHDVFVKLFQGLRHLENSKAFPGYFRKVTLSVVADHYRKWFQLPKVEPRSSEGVEVESRSLEEVVESVDDTLQTAVLIRSYLEHLPPQEREVLYLEFFRETPTKEIGKILNLTPGAVRMVKSRALKKLRKVLADEAETLSKISSRS